MSNADRQKAYRDRQRNAPVTESVTRSPETVTGVGGETVTRVTPARNVTRTDTERNGVIDEALDKMYLDAAEQVGLDVYYWPRNVPNSYDEWLRRYQPIPGDWDYVGCVDDTVTPAVLRSVV